MGKTITSGYDKAYRTTCTGCNSDIEYYGYDIEEKVFDPFIFKIPILSDFFSHTSREIDCPECGRRIIHQEYYLHKE